MSSESDGEAFAKVIRTALLSVGKSRGRAVVQKEIAEEIGVNYRTLQEWLGGRTTPGAAIALLRLLSLVPDEHDRLSLINLWTQRKEEAHPR